MLKKCTQREREIFGGLFQLREKERNKKIKLRVRMKGRLRESIKEKKRRGEDLHTKAPIGLM